MISFKIIVSHKKTGQSVCIKPPFYAYYADPFLIKSIGNKAILLFEVYNRLSKKGSISQAIIDFDRKTVLIKMLLSEPYHLSYPCPLFIKGEIYISPESSGANVQNFYQLIPDGDLYKCQKIDSLQHRMVDATFIPTAKNNEFIVYYYTGSSNNDGLLISSNLCFDRKVKFSLDKCKVMGLLRPAGLVADSLQPFQKVGTGYGKGLIFSEINFDQSSLQFSSEIKSNFDNFRPYQDTSHHISELENYLCFDVVSDFNISMGSNYFFNI